MSELENGKNQIEMQDVRKRLSLDIVRQEMLELRKIQTSSIDSLDTKASILIGFSSALLFVSIGKLNLEISLCSMVFGYIYLLFLMLSIAFLIIAYWVRNYKFNPSPNTLKKDYMFREPDKWENDKAGSKEQILSDQVYAYDCNEKVLDKKSFRVKFAIVFLSLAIASYFLQSSATNWR